MGLSRINWDEYFIAQAKIAALRATCTRLKVGAVIVRENRIVASGYNGSVSDSTHCMDEGCKMVEGHCVRTVHAEANAILQCARFGISTAGTTIYVTHFPCLACTKLLIQAGVDTIYYECDYRNDEVAIELLAEAQVAIRKIGLTYLKIDEHYQERGVMIRELVEYVREHSTDDSYISEINGMFEKLTEEEG